MSKYREHKYCKAIVLHSGSYRGLPCSRKAVKDGFCKQHHPDNVEARRKKSEERYEKKSRDRQARIERADWSMKVVREARRAMEVYELHNNPAVGAIDAWKIITAVMREEPK